MLKIEVDEVHRKITAGGDLRDVVADFGVAIHHLFNILQQNSTGAAAEFKHGMQSIITDPNSGVFEVTSVVSEGVAVIVPVADKE